MSKPLILEYYGFAFTKHEKINKDSKNFLIFLTLFTINKDFFRLKLFRRIYSIIMVVLITISKIFQLQLQLFFFKKKYLIKYNYLIVMVFK
jgi:hypothetical protein